MANGSLTANPSSSQGFTLVELMIVMAVMAVLVSAAMPLYELTSQRDEEKELRTGLRQIREAIDAYKRAVNDGRIARNADESGYPPKLEDLVAGVPDAKDPEKRKIYFYADCRAIPWPPIPDLPTPAPGVSVPMEVHRIILRKETTFSMCTHVRNRLV